MKTLYFKTNIHCSGCIKKVTPYLNNLKGIIHWEVDLPSVNKILTVKAESISPVQIAEAVKNAGFTCQLIKMD